MNVVIISGSPRKGSLTKRVAVHLARTLSTYEDLEVQFIDVRNYILPPVEMPFSSINDAPSELKPLAKLIFEADGFVLVTPEYNGSYSPAMKNLLDHFPKQNHKFFGIVTASPGAMGGMRAALQVQQLVYGLFGIGSPHMLIVPEVDKKFTSTGELTDVQFSAQVNQFIREYLWLAEKMAGTPVAA